MRPQLLHFGKIVIICCCFSAQIVSLLGSGVTTVGLALFAYQLTGGASATAVIGNALFLRILGFLLFSQPAGVLADRFNRKNILIAARRSAIISAPARPIGSRGGRRARSAKRGSCGRAIQKPRVCFVASGSRCCCSPGFRLSATRLSRSRAV